MTDVNLLGVLKRALHTHTDEEKKAIEVATFSADKEEEAKSATKPPPRMIMMKLPKPEV